MIFGPSHSFIWVLRSVLWKWRRTAHREKQQYEEEGRKGRKHLAEDKIPEQAWVSFCQTVSSSMGLAGKQSKEEGAGQTQAAELAGCAVPKGSFSKRVVCGFQCMEFHVLTQLSLLLLPPLDYLIKHVEEDAVWRTG